MKRKKYKSALGMPNPRTPEDNIKLSGLIYGSLLKGKAFQSPVIRAVSFLIGLLLLLPFVFTLLNTASSAGVFPLALNLAFNLVFAIPGIFIMYRAFKNQALI